jgi:hypothetical protein
MSWQILVIAAQIGIGGGLVLGGLRRAAHYWLAHRDKNHAEYLAKKLGEPKATSLRPAGIGVLMALAGALLLATTDMTVEMLRPPRPDQ